MRPVLIGLCSCVLAVESGRAEIRVRIQDYAQVSTATLADAIATASTILAHAGVGLVWANCAPDSETRDTVCSTPLGPMDLQVRILNRVMAERSHASRHSMGYAILAGPYPSIASVFYHRAVELEKGSVANRADILGAMLAHEIGHLLLGQKSHSGGGILRAQWSDQELKLIARGRMWFTPEETSRMIPLATERWRAGLTQLAVQSHALPELP